MQKCLMRNTMTAGSKPKYNIANYTSGSTNADTMANPPSSAGLNPYGMPLLNIGSRGNTSSGVVELGRSGQSNRKN